MQPTFRRDSVITSSRIVPPSQRPRRAQRRQHIIAHSIDKESIDTDWQSKNSQLLVVSRSQLLQGMAGAWSRPDYGFLCEHQQCELTGWVVAYAFAAAELCMHAVQALWCCRSGSA